MLWCGRATHTINHFIISGKIFSKTLILHKTALAIITIIVILAVLVSVKVSSMVHLFNYEIVPPLSSLVTTLHLITTVTKLERSSSHVSLLLCCDLHTVPVIYSRFAIFFISDGWWWVLRVFNPRSTNECVNIPTLKKDKKKHMISIYKIHLPNEIQLAQAITLANWHISLCHTT